MSWLIKWDGQELNSDDFTIADLGRVEKESGEPWSTANPFRDVAVARSFVGVALRRQGLGDKDVTAALDQVTLRRLKTAFEWVDDDSEGGEQEEPDPSAPPPDPTTPGS